MEELDIPSVLQMLAPRELKPIERVLAAHTGTVQVLLSLWFNDAVAVKVGRQSTSDLGVDRHVQLVLEKSGLVVARASSFIPDLHNSPEVKAEVEKQELGLGQVAVKLQIPTTRQITRLEVEPGVIRRRYTMSGRGLRYIITEEFDRALFADSPSQVLKAVME